MILALQIAHNRDARGLQRVAFTRDDRAGEGKLSSRLGLVTEAIEAPEDMDLYAYLVAQTSESGKADYVIMDEAQFLEPDQIDQLARIVDDLDMDAFAFGITTDFRTKLFPGSQRLIELADRLEQLQVEALCSCGAVQRQRPRPRRGARHPAVVVVAQDLVADLLHRAVLPVASS